MGPFHTLVPDEAKTAAGVSGSASPVSVIVEEMFRMERARKTSTTGKSSWHVVVQQSRLAERRRLLTSERYVPRSDVSTGRRAVSGAAPPSMSTAGEEAAVGSAGAASARGAVRAGDAPPSRSFSCLARRSSADSFILRKTSSRVVHVAPYSETPSLGSEPSSASSSDCSVRRSWPGSRTRSSRRDSEAVRAAGTKPLRKASTAAASKAESLALMRDSE
mmetsp:Transcript_53386/g.158012  ORF Transcript_53386/g.158012 Transcript_53386/m.158012 type:complete len:219 (-) Transcript_53386:783-1439(-)